MASTTVRISQDAKAVLQRMAQQTGRPMQAVLDEAVELYRRQRFLDEANAAFTALKADEEAWAAERAERDAWDAATSNDAAA